MEAVAPALILVKYIAFLGLYGAGTVTIRGDKSYNHGDEVNLT